MSYSDYSLAFYKAKGTFADRVIRAVTRSPYSHVELIQHYGTAECRAVSSSVRDSGVRIKSINLANGNWDVVHLRNWVEPDAWDKAASHIGARYDFTGVMFNQFLSLRRDNAAKWFCSELCAMALGIRAPQRLAPGDLFFLAMELNAAFVAGMQEAKA